MGRQRKPLPPSQTQPHQQRLEALHKTPLTIPLSQLTPQPGLISIRDKQMPEAPTLHSQDACKARMSRGLSKAEQQLGTLVGADSKTSYRWDPHTRLMSAQTLASYF